jgi:hypothetical protein
MARDSSAAGHGIVAGSTRLRYCFISSKCAGVGLRSGSKHGNASAPRAALPHGGSMIRKLALGFLGANALVLAMAAATLAGQHNAPPAKVVVTPTTTLMLPAVTVSIPDVGYVHPVPLRITPMPVLPAATRSVIMPVERSTRAVLARKRIDAKPRLRAQPKVKPGTGGSDNPELTPGLYAASGSNGGRGFL